MLDAQNYICSRTMWKGRKMRNLRLAFSLVELLVVVAIIGVLVALLLPAVQKARASARRTVCKNQLKQIGLGNLNYESARRALPSNGWEGFSWIHAVLPFMEGQVIESPEIDELDANDLAKYLAAPDANFYCPSRREALAYPWNGSFFPDPPPFPEITLAAKTDYAGNGGTGLYTLGAPDKKSRKVNGNNGVLNFVPIRLKRIKDGTSKTYLVCEKSVAPAQYAKGDWGDTGAYVLTSLGSFNSHIRFGDFPPSQDSDASPSKFFGYGSAHTGAWNVVMCDGSVRSMNYSISLTMNKRLSERADGLLLTQEEEPPRRRPG